MAISWQRAHDAQTKYAEQVSYYQVEADRYDELAKNEPDKNKRDSYIKALVSCRENVAHAQGLVRQMQAAKILAAEREGRDPEPKDPATIEANIIKAVADRQAVSDTSQILQNAKEALHQEDKRFDQREPVSRFRQLRESSRIDQLPEWERDR